MPSPICPFKPVTLNLSNFGLIEDMDHHMGEFCPWTTTCHGTGGREVAVTPVLQPHTCLQSEYRIAGKLGIDLEKILMEVTKVISY